MTKNLNLKSHLNRIKCLEDVIAKEKQACKEIKQTLETTMVKLFQTSFKKVQFLLNNSN
jgi:hypothetical protein